MTFPENEWIDFTGFNASVALSQQPEMLPYPISLGAWDGENTRPGVANWDINRIYRGISSLTCRVRDETPPTAIGKPFHITKSMLAPVQGLYRLLPRHSCTYNENLLNDKPIELSVDGSKIHLGERSWEIASDSESVLTFARDFRSDKTIAPVPGPGFILESQLGPNRFSVHYARNTEIQKYCSLLRSVKVNRALYATSTNAVRTSRAY
jgi:hypothetical protein